MPAALVLGDKLAITSGRAERWALGLALAATWLPVRGWSAGPWWVPVVVSHYLAGGLIVLGLLARARWQLGSSRSILMSAQLDSPGDRKMRRSA